MSVTSRLELPYIAAGQAQKHVTHNDALDRIDALMHLDVASRQLTSPPPSPVEGAQYIVPPGATGVWAGQDDHIMTLDGANWQAQEPVRGLVAYVADEQTLVVFNGTEWVPVVGPLSDVRVDKLGIHADPHATAGLIMASERAILSHVEPPTAQAGVQLVLNKSTVSATASILYQQAWQGRAEIGLCGTNELALKVSANGSTWSNAMLVDHTNGNAQFPGRVIIGAAPSLGYGLTIAHNSPSIVVKDTLGVGNGHTSVLSFVDKNGAEKVWMGLGSANNSEFTFLSHYSDGMTFYAYGGNHPISFLQNGVSRMRVHSNGYVGISENNPTAPLHVNGAARVGSFAKASLPSASALGAGSMIFVPDDAAGATLAF